MILFKPAEWTLDARIVSYHPQTLEQQLDRDYIVNFRDENYGDRFLFSRRVNPVDTATQQTCEHPNAYWYGTHLLTGKIP